MNKRFTFLAVLLFVFSKLSCMAAIGDLFTYAGFNYCIIADSEVALMSCVTEPEGHITIPGEVYDGTNSYTVTQISYRAFKGRNKIKSVTISEGIKSISDYAFFECRAMESVVLPNTLNSIGDHSFYSCSALSAVDIPSSVNFIGYEAFGNSGLKKVNTNDIEAWCKIKFDRSAFVYGTDLYLNGELLHDLIIPPTITKINDCAFGAFENITSVIIPNSVTTIGEYAFGSTGIFEVVIPNSVTTIGADAFYNCLYLTDIHIPESVTTIDCGAFSQTPLGKVYITNLEAWCNIDFGDEESNRTCHTKRLYLNGKEIKELVIPESITQIKDYTFFGFDHINYVTFPKNLNSIGKLSFSRCTTLRSLEIPETVTFIGDAAFGDCQFVQTIIIPDSVKYIGYKAFGGCSSLTTLTIGRNVEEFGSYLDYKNEIISKQWYGCPNLKDITYMSPNPVDGNGNLSNMFDEDVYQKATLHYLDEATDKINTRSPWNLFVNKGSVSGITDIEYNIDNSINVYNINGLKTYHGPESEMNLPTGVYIIIKNGQVTKQTIIR